MPLYQSALAKDIFKDQIIIVTGGGSGIGRCTAHELASLGAQVILTGRTEEKLQQVKQEIIEDGGKASYRVCDNRDEEKVKQTVSSIVEEFGQINGLVNNAGGQFPAFLETMSANAFDSVIRNNLLGTFLMMREVFNQSMVKTGGSIVNMTIDMWSGLPSMGHSGAARAGIDNLTKTSALEWARAGVRVNAVAPGWVMASGLDSYKDGMKAMIPTVSSKIPLKRMATESEISALMCFLLSPAASFITGMNVRIDGGASLVSPFFPLIDHEKSIPFEAFHRDGIPNVIKEMNQSKL
ncbi:SDR family oxidoreductase [Acinetobacter baumannii]|uniref:SDR family oxidoreductase n=1 Tax=Acinetobacter baumannii TaxID=470 RepID=UPI00028CA51A|nr:SDR family oxidoreductase [Acinetobacter baumannii]EHU1440708.1 SDR family oxidoreductase [Acinetobacter baumannii]EHU1808528.1 SDR family oxidoreductase [Acinetobacter baumannii]EHU2697916.1 SDR family oxidoreductase [Acinetobacter baumannii]EKL57464.1 KR domain protein [Acinetobacter baumannii OIFC110]TPT85393.1 SDR family oxidoreductase [Acinetobacter baumannii]